MSRMFINRDKMHHRRAIPPSPSCKGTDVLPRLTKQHARNPSMRWTASGAPFYDLRSTFMQLGIIGLGRMGGNIARRLMLDGHTTVVYDRDEASRSALANEGSTAVADLAELVSALEKPRAVWVMLPAGAPTEDTIQTLSQLLEADDVIIDGGNTFYKDDIRRAQELSEKGLHYVDVGTSGGVWGLERGYCMMIGGDVAAVERLDPLFASLAPGLGSIE
ncbi:6-phosphogluconate dehydrogenase-like protein, partial [Pseudomonas syringae pv. primulae]